MFKHWLLGLIVLLAFILRVWNITSSPAGLSIDEASIGYNAWSIITSGKDEYGIDFPLFFKAFGEHKLPVFIYSVAFIQLLLGPIDLSVRLPAVLFGLGTIICFYLFCRIFLREFFDHELSRTGAYLAAFLMAISPWHIQFTRTGFEASSALFFVTLGIFLFFKHRHSGSLIGLTCGVLSLLLALYSYNSARIVVPVLLIGLMFIYFKSFKLHRWIISLLIGFLLIIPFILFVLSPEGSARAREVVVFYYPQTKPIVEVLISNYWSNISPYYLFYYGDPTLSHTTSHRMSLLYLIELPFFYIGLILLLIKIRKSAFLIIWFLIGAVPPAITILNPHALRGFLVLPVLIFISVFGFLSCLKLIKRELFRKTAIAIYCLSLLYLCLNFLFIYHNLYVRDAGWDWLTDVKSVSGETLHIKNDYQEIYFEEGGFREIAYLWHLKYPPLEYQKLTDKKAAGNFHFESAYENIPKTGNDLFISRTPNLPEKLIETISYPNGSPAFYLYKL